MTLKILDLVTTLLHGLLRGVAVGIDCAHDVVPVFDLEVSLDAGAFISIAFQQPRHCGRVPFKPGHRRCLSAHHCPYLAILIFILAHTLRELGHCLLDGYGISKNVAEEDELTAAVISEKSKMWVRNRNRDRVRPKDSLSDDGFLTDLSTFSLKGQRKQLKKVLKEEQKVNRDAEDLVKWVKQASTRIDDRVLDDLLSDQEEFK